MILAIFIGVLLYTIIGIQYARVRYANEITALDNARMASSRRASVNPKNRSESISAGIRHRNNCWFYYGGGRDYRTLGCDCGAVEEYNAGATEYKVHNPYLMAIGYPVYGLDSYIKNGKSKEINYAELARLEKQAGIEN